MYVKTEEIRIDDIPQDIENFNKAAVDMMIDPVKTAALFIFALNIYSKDKEQGNPLLNHLIADDAKSINFINIERNPQIARSYLKGATPNNGYTPQTPYTVLIRYNEEKGIKRNFKNCIRWLWRYW